MFETKLNRDITLKSEIVLRKGLTVKVYPGAGDTDCQICTEGVYYRLRYTSVLSLPSSEELGEMISDGVCMSVAGNGPIEPDGHDPEGFPSWLLVLGMI
jgi:hypothetical protein